MPRSKAATAAAPSRANGRARFDQLGGVIDRNAKPNSQKTQRRRRGKVNADRRSSIPHVNANALAVTDGTVTAGFIVEHIGAHFAFGPDQKLIGNFPTRAAAIAALPKVSR